MLVHTFLLGQVVDIDVQLIHMGRGFRDGRNGNRHDRSDSLPRGFGQREYRQSEDVGIRGLRQDAEQVYARGELDDKRREATQDRPEQQRQLPPEALQIDGKDDGRQQCDERDNPCIVGCRGDSVLRHSECAGRVHRERAGVRERVGRKREADDHGDRAGDGRRQDLFDDVTARPVDKQTCDDRNESRHNDTELRIGDLRVEVAALCRFGGHDA